MSDKTFRDKAVIVTGASSGIGRALALRLAVWMKVIAPGLLDKITVGVFLKPVARRVQTGKDR